MNRSLILVIALVVLVGFATAQRDRDLPYRTGKLPLTRDYPGKNGGGINRGRDTFDYRRDADYPGKNGGGINRGRDRDRERDYQNARNNRLG